MAKFCRSCGTAVPDEKPSVAICSSCGRELTPDAAFCRFCGAKRGGASAQIPSDPAARTPAYHSASVRDASGTVPHLPDYMRPGYRKQVEAARQAAQTVPAAKKRRGGLCVFLSLLMAAELCVAGFKYPGFLRQKGGGSGPFGITSGGKNDDGPAGDGFAAELLAYFGMTEEDYAQ